MAVNTQYMQNYFFDGLHVIVHVYTMILVNVLYMQVSMNIYT